jgi:hypothetical protein
MCIWYSTPHMSWTMNGVNEVSLTFAKFLHRPPVSIPTTPRDEVSVYSYCTCIPPGNSINQPSTSSSIFCSCAHSLPVAILCVLSVGQLTVHFASMAFCSASPFQPKTASCNVSTHFSILPWFNDLNTYRNRRDCRTPFCLQNSTRKVGCRHPATSFGH